MRGAFFHDVTIKHTSDDDGRCWIIETESGYWRYGTLKSLAEDLVLWVKGKNENKDFVAKQSLEEVSAELRAKKIIWSIFNYHEDGIEVRFDIHAYGEREMAKVRVKTEKEVAGFLAGQLEKQHRREAFKVDLF